MLVLNLREKGRELGSKGKFERVFSREEVGSRGVYIGGLTKEVVAIFLPLSFFPSFFDLYYYYLQFFYKKKKKTLFIVFFVFVFLLRFEFFNLLPAFRLPFHINESFMCMFHERNSFLCKTRA